MYLDNNEIGDLIKLFTDKVTPLEQRVKKLEKERFWLELAAIFLFILCSLGLLTAVVLIFIGVIPVENYFMPLVK